MINIYLQHKVNSVPLFTTYTRSFLLSVMFTLLFLTGSTAIFAQTVTSDKDDYAPGEIATITGSGWTDDQMVHVEFKEEPDYPDFHIYDVPVDTDGNWEIKYNIE